MCNYSFDIIKDIIKPRWTVEIILSINSGNRRYMDIFDSIDFLSHTELQRKLEFLTKRAIVKKENENNTSIYTLTAFGSDIVHMLEHMNEINKKYSLLQKTGKKP